MNALRPAQLRIMYLYLTSIDHTLLFTFKFSVSEGILWRRTVALKLHRRRRDVLVECALQGVLY
jgi:hypothetical protein